MSMEKMSQAHKSQGSQMNLKMIPVSERIAQELSRGNESQGLELVSLKDIDDQMMFSFGIA